MTQQATVVLRGGRVLTPSGFAEALAVNGDSIVAVGSNSDIDEFRSSTTRVVDLKGRLAIPAFGDAHIHAITGGLESLRCNLLGMRTRADCLEAVATYAQGLDSDEWVLGGGWAMEAFPGGVPTATDLDDVCFGRPAFLPNRDHHSAWVNTLALERAGIDSSTPDPIDGRIERDEAGNPTGALHDGAMGLVARFVPRPSTEELDAGLRAALVRLHSHGITHWQDACVGAAGELGIVDTYDTYRRADEQGWLTGRVVGALWWDRTRGLDQMAELQTRRETSGSGFRATAVKMMMDGVCETFTAAMSRAYLGEAGRQGTHAGSLFIEPDEVTASVAALDAEGFQVHFHAIGDRAVSTALDALEALPVARRGAARHHLAHLQFIKPRDLDRFGPLGAIANFQPLWACHDPQMDELTIPVVGHERADWQYSIASLARRSVGIAFGSDWPVSSPDPLQEIHVAVNRRLSAHYGTAGTRECDVPFRADQALSVAEAISAFTQGVAYVNGDEQRLGMLDIGAQADIAVLDQDLFTISPEEIGSCSVDLTMSAGRIVHGDE